jgi:DNA-binding NarL/FixJ family response regulator
MSTIRVILADDHAVCREGIHRFLDEAEDIEVLAEAVDGEAAKSLISAYKPDVALLDIRMPGATGIEVTRWIREHSLPVAVLILSAYDDGPFIKAAFQSGANGYILKDADADEIASAVRSIHRGQSALGPTITQKLMAQVAGNAPESLIEPLTGREQEVLELAATGLTNRGIGSKLGISDRTVQGHLGTIYEKLQVGSRTEAVTKALHFKLIDSPPNDLPN